jgi:GAF domain-containing protein
VQSDKVGGLTGVDETALLALAQQVAIAVHNARMFSETHQALEQVQKIQRQYTGEAWEKFIAEQPTRFEVRRADAPPLEETAMPELASALQSAKTVWVTPDQAEDGIKSLATPLKLRNQVIGVLGLRDEENKNGQWTEDEIALIEAVSEQMSLAIENARLFEETGRRAGREKTIANITQKVWASSDLEQLMETTVEQLGLNLDASRVVIRLGTADQLIQHDNDENDPV